MRYRHSNLWDETLCDTARSSNAQYRYILIIDLLVNKKEKEDRLDLMYSCVFWCEFVDLLGEFL